MPTAPDKAAQRDGVDLKPPAQHKFGERSYWLQQMVALSQPNDWTERFQCDPNTLIQAVVASEYVMELLDAFSESAIRHRDSAWLRAVCYGWLHLNDPRMVTPAVAQLLAAAREDERGTLLEWQFSELSKSDLDFAFTLLGNVDVPWTSSLTTKAFETLLNRARNERQQWSHNRNALSPWGSRCDVQTAMQMLPRLLDATSTESPWRNALEELNDVVEFRAAMKREMV